MPALPNRLPGLNFDLGETADMLRSQVEAFSAAEIATLRGMTKRNINCPRTSSAGRIFSANDFIESLELKFSPTRPMPRWA